MSGLLTNYNNLFAALLTWAFSEFLIEGEGNINIYLLSLNSKYQFSMKIRTHLNNKKKTPWEDLSHLWLPENANDC